MVNMNDRLAKEIVAWAFEEFRNNVNSRDTRSEPWLTTFTYIFALVDIVLFVEHDNK